MEEQENNEQIMGLVFKALNEIDLDDSDRKLEVPEDTVIYGDGGCWSRFNSDDIELNSATTCLILTIKPGSSIK